MASRAALAGSLLQTLNIAHPSHLDISSRRSNGGNDQAIGVSCTYSDFLSGRSLISLTCFSQCKDKSARGNRLLVRCSSSQRPSPVIREGPPSDTSGSSSYLGMWKRAKEMEEEKRRNHDREVKKRVEEEAAASAEADARGRREQQLSSILQVSGQEREKVEKQMVLDRAAAALAAVEAVLADVAKDRRARQAERGRPTANTLPAFMGGKTLSLRRNSDSPSPTLPPVEGSRESTLRTPGRITLGVQSKSPTYAPPAGSGSGSATDLEKKSTPGPDFWSWAPPPVDPSARPSSGPAPELRRASAPTPPERASLMEKERQTDSLGLPMQSEVDLDDITTIMQQRAGPSLPPMQSLLEVKDAKREFTRQDEAALEQNLTVPQLQSQVAAMVNSSSDAGATSESGMLPDGARWWRETGVEERANGEVCHWTVIRGVSADGAVEFEEKWWETSDTFDYKELGAEKSGRDATGAVWRETWREAMWQDAKNGLPHIEKTADKWARDGAGGEWHEKWWEHYDAQGRAEKSADKWSKIDEDTPLHAGHAHVWHERWGEEYDGRGAAMKYCDKWAERKEEDGQWVKWGDKWDERFDRDATGKKGGETWWEGAGGERWNRTWGEGHNNSGWVHKYGQSSSGEHWDTHEPMDTWYERKAHFGFKECLENSGRLQQVGRRPKGKL